MTRSLPSTSTQSSTRRKVQPLSFLVRPLGPLRQTISSRLAQAGRKLPVSSRRCSLAAALTQSPPHGSLALRATRSSPSVSAATAASTAPAVLRPVHAVGHQLHHVGTDCREIDSHRLTTFTLKWCSRRPPLALAAEGWPTAVQMGQSAPTVQTPSPPDGSTPSSCWPGHPPHAPGRRPGRSPAEYT